MLRICIPVHNEATTIGVLLWRLRSVFQGFSREYDVIVYDDASTDGTGEVLEPYQSVMPLTVLRGAVHRGYAASIDALVRHVAADDEYARRDAMVLLQGDFTESPEHLPELVKRFEGGADLVAVHRTVSDATPADERRLRRWGRWAVKPFLRLPPVADPFTGFRLVRISVLRELLRALGSRPVCAGEGWAANIDFALNVAPFARRIENVEFAPRYDVRQRASRRRGWADVMALFHWARSARGTMRPVPGSKGAVEAPGKTDRGSDVSIIPVSTDRSNRTSERQSRDRGERFGRPERERGGRGAARGGEGVDERVAKAADERVAKAADERVAKAADERVAKAADERSSRASGDEPRPPRAERPPRDERPNREPRTGRDERPAREERTTAAREERPTREERGPRPERPPRETREPRPPRPTRPELPAAHTSTSLSEAPVEPLTSGLTEIPGAEDDTSVAEPLDAGVPAGEKKARRRRRRSRRDRAEREPGQSAADGGEASDEFDDRRAGTSEAGQGEHMDGGDERDDVESGQDSATDAGGETAQRKRRSRRRRRGRRPGGTDAAGGDDASPPPAPESPVA